jgi:hypothetical protein
MECVVNAKTRPLYPPPLRYPLYRGWVGSQSRFWKGRKISPATGVRSQDRSARSKSQYRLSYPTVILKFFVEKEPNCHKCKMLFHITCKSPNLSEAIPIVYVINRTIEISRTQLHWNILNWQIPAGRRKPYDFRKYFYGLRMTPCEGRNMVPV